MNGGDLLASVSLTVPHHQQNVGAEGAGGWYDDASRSSARDDAAGTASFEQPSSTQLTDFLTQTADLTQLGHEYEEEEDTDGDERAADSTLASGSGSGTSPFVSHAAQPWGRLMSCGGATGHTSSIIPLLPRPPRHSALLGVLNNNAIGGTSQQFDHKQGPIDISVADIFNEYTIGRSRTRCDICVQPEQEGSPCATSPRKRNRKANLDWCYSLISNQHCKLYCTLDETVWNGRSSLGTHQGLEIGKSSVAVASTKHPSAWHVWIEDCSGNGTVVNGSTVLRKGDKRLLHAGDEICLVYPPTLLRKIASQSQVALLVQQFSYVFVNNQCAPRVMPPPPQSVHNSTTAPPARLQPRTPSLLAKVTQRAHYQQQQQEYRTASSRCVAVDARTATRRRRMDSTSSSPPSHPLDVSASQSSDSHQNSRISRRISPRRQPPRHLQQDYDLRDVLGRGTMGEVRRAIHRQTGQQFAVKILSLVRQRGPWNQTTEIEREAAILRQLQHPYVVKLYDVYTCPEAIYLVMELVAGGDLFDRIVDKGSYSEVNSRRVMRRLLAAVYYLHEGSGLHIVHRDLKPENILLSTTTSDIDVKLTDFGLAKPDGDLKTFCGTPQYFAPEVLRRRHTVKGSGRYGKQADMWSLGVILYVLLTGMPPFDEDSGTPSVVDFPDTVPESARDLVRQLLQHDPRQRATVLTACTHAWILTADGDTHVHPLDDPLVPDCNSNGTASRDDSFATTQDIALNECTTRHVPRVSSETHNAHEMNTKANVDPAGGKSTLQASSTDNDKENVFAGAAVTSRVDETVMIRPIRSLEGAIEASTDLTLLKSSNRPSKGRLSATNFSFRPHNAIPVTSCATSDPLRPRDAPRQELSTPKTAMFEPSRLQHSSFSGSFREEEPSPSGAFASAKTLRVRNTNAITPSMSVLRGNESMDNIDQSSTTIQRDGEVLDDDEVQSMFTDNTESLSSFSTIPVDSDCAVTFDPKDTDANTVVTSVTSHRKRKRDTVVTAKTKPTKAKATPTTKIFTGGKQTTLNKWFKK